MFPRVNDGNRQDNNFLQAPPTGPQVNNPQMDLQWNRPPDGPGNNIPPNTQMWIVNPAPQFTNPPVTQQWNGNTNPQNTQSSDFHETFLKAKPKALGIVLIVVGILQIVLGIGSLYTTYYITIISGIPFWGSIFFIIAGSLSVAGHSRPSIRLVKGSLGFNILTSSFTILGLILTIVDFASSYFYYFNWVHNCYRYSCAGIINGGHAIRAGFFLTYLLLFSISVSISVFACRAVNHPTTVPPQVFVVQSAATFSVPPSANPGYTPANYQSPPPPTYYMPQDGVKGGPMQ